MNDNLPLTGLIGALPDPEQIKVGIRVVQRYEHELIGDWPRVTTMPDDILEINPAVSRSLVEPNNLVVRFANAWAEYRPAGRVDGAARWVLVLSEVERRVEMPVDSEAETAPH
jgi:hypothetical protein